MVITSVSSNMRAAGDYSVNSRYNVVVLGRCEDSGAEKPTPQHTLVQFFGVGLTCIQASYPGAKLLEIQATSPCGWAVDNPLDLSNLKIICVLKDGRAATIHSVGWGEFGPIQISDQPWTSDEIVEWPFRRDPVSSFLKLRHAGYTGKCSSCVLRKPEHPKIKEPYHIYAMEDGSWSWTELWESC